VERRDAVTERAFEKTVLPNGLRVLTAPMPQAKSVACFVMLAAGSRYETRDTNGIAHFSEHMFFKGTERRPSAREIAGEIDAIGGEFNAFTGKEYTGYYVKCAAEHRDVALDVLVDMLRHSKFDPEEIEREKGVIVEEMNMYYDTPREYLEGVYDELLYGDQPLGWDIIGRKETVRGATRETFLGYLDRWYRAPRMVAGVAGAVGDDVVARVEELLGDVGDGSTGEPAPVEWEQAEPRVKIHSKQSDQAHVRLGVHSYPLGHPDRYALSVLATVLGGGMSSRLFSEVRERRGLAYYIYGYNQGYTDTGTLFAQGGVDINRIDEAVATVVAEFGRIAREPVSEDELVKARNFGKGRLVLSLEDPRGLVVFGLRSEVLEGRIREPDEVLAGLDAVTVDDVQRVAQDIVREHRLNLAVIGPFDDADRFERLLAFS
jgi:predicted Zn-dependent peptidase